MSGQPQVTAASTPAMTASSQAMPDHLNSRGRRDRRAPRTSSASVTRPSSSAPSSIADDVARLAQRRRARLDDHRRAGGERVVGLARVGLVGADGDDRRVVGDERAVEQRLARGRAAADDVGALTARRRRPPGRRMSTCSMGGSRGSAATWAAAWGSGRRRATRASRGEGADRERRDRRVRTLSPRSRRAPRSGRAWPTSKTTQTPWMRGSPPTGSRA